MGRGAEKYLLPLLSLHFLTIKEPVNKTVFSCAFCLLVESKVDTPSPA